MNDVATKQTPKMMKGTEGNLDYMVIARHGGIAMGIKNNYLGPGRVPKTFYVGFRIRSARAGKLFDEDDAKTQQVITLADAKLTPVSAWPDILPWEKVRDDYASMQTGVFVSIENKTLIEALKEELEGKSIAKKIAYGIVNMLGEASEYLIMDKRVIRDLLHEHFSTQFGHIIHQMEKANGLNQSLAQDIGSFGIQSKSLKALQEKYGTPSTAEDIDPDEEEEEDEIDAEEDEEEDEEGDED